MAKHGTFGENNPVWKAVNRVADMFIISILFTLTCIPIFTIGAAVSGFYYAVMDSLRKEDGYMFKRYFKSFAKNFKQATPIWLIMLFVGTAIVLDIYFALTQGGGVFWMFILIVGIVLGIAWLITLSFVFALQARFENTIFKTIENAFLIGVTHLPFTVSVIIVIAICGFLCYISNLGLFVMLIFGFGLVGYLMVNSFERLFKKLGYIDEDDGKIEEDDYDFSVDVDFDEIYGRDEEAEETDDDYEDEDDVDVPSTDEDTDEYDDPEDTATSDESEE